MICLRIRQKDELVQSRTELARKRRHFRDYQIMGWSLFTGFIMGITPTVFTYARSFRPNASIGGEIFFPLLPVVLYPAYAACCRMVWKKVKRQVCAAQQIGEGRQVDGSRKAV